MRRYGFSTGALAKSDFRQGLVLQRQFADAVELSALRESELKTIVDALPSLPLSQFGYVSFHAPSKLAVMSEQAVVETLQRTRGYVHAIIVHPDVIQAPKEWRSIEDLLVLENMDQRKPCARTADEMRGYFEQLPNARFCLDIGHARQVDPTMGVALELLLAFRDRLAEIHISEVDADSQHVAISSAAMKAFQRLARLIPDDIPVIVESVILTTAIADEIASARIALQESSIARMSVCVES
jgi:hypothetical protein